MRIVKLLPVLLFATLVSSLSYAVVPDRISGALTVGPTVTLKGSVHRKALPKYDQGPADPALHLGSVTLLTLPSAAQQKALTQLLAEQQNRKSPNYHKWLTPEQWADRFGLSHNDVQKLTGWLKSKGFRVSKVARGRNWITFSGTAGQVQSAFGTELHRYNVNGELHVSNATAPKIPSALAGIVSGVRGLNDFHLKPMTVKNARAARPAYFDPIFAPPATQNFLAPGDIATIYDINALYNASTPIDGTGQKLAVIGQTDIFITDINDFRAGFNFSTISGCTSDPTTGVVTACDTTNFQYVLVPDSTDTLTPSLGDLTEADLDIEWSGAVARNAQIIYVNAPETFSGQNLISGGVWDAWYYAVDNQIAPVISLSYGSCEFFDNNVLDSTGQPLADEVELMKANSEGITFLNSTGDAGAAECDGPTNSQTIPANLAVGGLAVSYPASSPEVTAVGGTAVTYPAGFSTTYWGTTNGLDGGSAQNAPLPETSWNDDEELIFLQSGSTAASWQQNYAIVSTGGGPSNCAEQSADNSNCVAGFGQPSWQTVTLSGQSGSRFSPDVSLAASPNFPGYIFCTPQDAWISGSTNTAGTCASGIAAALALTDGASPPNPAPSLVGGTSASTPVMAGIVTLLNQYFGTNGLGNINPTLYSLAATPSNLAFHPVTTGDNNVYCEVGQPVAPWPVAMQCPAAGVFGYSASTSDAITGYNLVTGLGSVDVANLAVAWADSTAAIDFTVTPTVATFQVSQGAPINATINVELASGFTGPITFTCTDPAPLSICTVPPNTNVSGQVSFAITTTAPTAELRRPSDRTPRIFYAFLLPGLLGLVFTAGSRRRSWRGMRFLGLVLVLGFSTLWLASCGGGNSSSSGNSNPGTPKGSYTITVTGTAGSEIATSSFQLTVQ
jgi:subtilase family serine protease